MSNVKISWLQQDASVLKMSPWEELQASLQWNTKKPINEPWLAIITPTTLSQEYFAIALSLNAFNKFTEKVIDEFKNECRNIMSLYSPNEIEEIRNEEILKGNTGKLCIVEERILKLITPFRLLDQSKSAIESVFTRVEGCVIETANTD